MRKHKSIDKQVMVITGASSGIGMTVAEMAAERGARVVLAARSEEKLAEIVDRLHRRGLQATYVPADVSDEGDVEAIAAAATEEFGGIDTWVNVAAQSIYGRAEDVSIKDARRLFDVNYFGMVNGCKVAVPCLRQRGGGALINVGSVASDVALPLLSHYSATKHAIKGFTDALRLELEKDGEDISVTLVKPGSVNTPFTQHAKNLMEVEPTYPPPVYKPEVVARAILHCAISPTRDVLVGGGAKRYASLAENYPRLTDKYMEAAGFEKQRSDRPTDGRREGNLWQPYDDEEPSRYGDYDGHVRASSMYTQAKLHPLLTSFGAVALGAGTLYALGKVTKKASKAGLYAYAAKKLLGSESKEEKRAN